MVSEEFVYTLEGKGRVLLHVLDAIRRLALSEAGPALSVLARKRILTEIGSNDDLHGFLLITLSELNQLEPIETWHVESAFREYAPLAFSFVRDQAPADIPRLVPTVAALGFLLEAFESFFTNGTAEGITRLGPILDHVRELQDDRLSSQVEHALSQLPLDSASAFALLTRLRRTAHSKVLIRIDDGALADALRAQLERLGIAVESSWTVGVYNRDLYSVVSAKAAFHHLDPSTSACLAVFESNDPASAAPLLQYRIDIATIPTDTSRAASTLTRRICDILLVKDRQSRPASNATAILTPSYSRAHRPSRLLAALQSSDLT